MISKIVTKIFGSRSPFESSSSFKPKVPKTFAQKKRSLLWNRYAGLVYFLICWHFVGYMVFKLAHEKAKQEGIDPYPTVGTPTRIRIGSDFKIKVSSDKDEVKVDDTKEQK